MSDWGRGLEEVTTLAAFSSTVGHFHAAATGAGEWSDALAALARATGSWGGELLGLGGAESPTFYCDNPIAGEAIDAFVAAQGYDLRVNSRMRVGLSAPELKVLDERDFTTSADMSRYPAYGEVLRTYDVRHVALTTLIRRPEQTVGLGLLRGETQGNIDDEAKRFFEAVAPHAQAAARTCLALGGQAIATSIELLESLRVAAFVCDANGRVVAASSGAERLLQDQPALTAQRGILSAETPEQTSRLHAAIRAVTRDAPIPTELPEPFVIIDRHGGRLPVLVSKLPPPHGFSLRRLALVTIKPYRRIDGEAGALARALFDLTPRETQVAGLLASGLSPDRIAANAGVSIATVRAHLRSIFAKAEVNSQSELLAKLAAHW